MELCRQNSKSFIQKVKELISIKVPNHSKSLEKIFDKEKLSFTYKSKFNNNESSFRIGNYLIKNEIGSGTFGKVKLAIFIPTKEKVAVKIIEKSKLKEKDDLIRLEREFEMLAQFNHPNLIMVTEIFESQNSYYTVMDYCGGGELFDYIVKKKFLPEDESSFFFYQLINGLEYIHSLGIVHRDLKPENLLLTNDHILKIIDFGLSNYFKPEKDDLLYTPCGSPCYASPEMVTGNNYDGIKIDIWSSGVILFVMLCGYLPFVDKTNEKMFHKIAECKVEYPNYLSDIAVDLLKKILVPNPNERISIENIKKHPFYLKGKYNFEQQFTIQYSNDEDNKAKEKDNKDKKKTNNSKNLIIEENNDFNIENNKKNDNMKNIDKNIIKEKENNTINNDNSIKNDNYNRINVNKNNKKTVRKISIKNSINLINKKNLKNLKIKIKNLQKNNHKNIYGEFFKNNNITDKNNSNTHLSKIANPVNLIKFNEELKTYNQILENFANYPKLNKNRNIKHKKNLTQNNNITKIFKSSDAKKKLNNLNHNSSTDLVIFTNERENIPINNVCSKRYNHIKYPKKKSSGNKMIDFVINKLLKKPCNSKSKEKGKKQELKTLSKKDEVINILHESNTFYDKKSKISEKTGLSINNNLLSNNKKEGNLNSRKNTLNTNFEILNPYNYHKLTKSSDKKSHKTIIKSNNKKTQVKIFDNIQLFGKNGGNKSVRHNFYPRKKKINIKIKKIDDSKLMSNSIQRENIDYFSTEIGFNNNNTIDTKYKYSTINKNLTNARKSSIYKNKFKAFFNKNHLNDLKLVNNIFYKSKDALIDSKNKPKKINNFKNKFNSIRICVRNLLNSDIKVKKCERKFQYYKLNEGSNTTNSNSSKMSTNPHNKNKFHNKTNSNFFNTNILTYNNSINKAYEQKSLSKNKVKKKNPFLKYIISANESWRQYTSSDVINKGNKSNRYIGLIKKNENFNKLIKNQIKAGNIKVKRREENKRDNKKNKNISVNIQKDLKQKMNELSETNNSYLINDLTINTSLRNPFNNANKTTSLLTNQKKNKKIKIKLKKNFMNYEGNLLTNSMNINNNTKPYYNIRNTFINLNMHPNYDLEIKDNIGSPHLQNLNSLNTKINANSTVYKRKNKIKGKINNQNSLNINDSYKNKKLNLNQLLNIQQNLLTKDNKIHVNYTLTEGSNNNKKYIKIRPNNKNIQINKPKNGSNKFNNMNKMIKTKNYVNILSALNYNRNNQNSNGNINEIQKKYKNITESDIEPKKEMKIWPSGQLDFNILKRIKFKNYNNMTNLIEHL